MTGGASPRRRGDYFERQAKADLEAHGWLVVRAAGSLGPCDLVAIKRGQRPMLVSCKIGGRITPAERVALAVVAHRFDCTIVVASRPKAGTVLYTPLVTQDDSAAATAAK